MKKLWLVIGASAREQMRWAGQHLYTLLILGPLVFGMSYATVSRLAEEAPAWQPTPRLALILACLFALSLLGLSLTRASVELYHLRRPESLLDALPVSPEVQLHAALSKRLTRTLIIGLLLWAARVLFTGGGTLDAKPLLQLLLWVALVAITELFGALNWIHWGHTRQRLWALGAALATLISVLLSGLLLYNFFGQGVWESGQTLWLMACSAVWTLGLYLVTRATHNRWRSFDLEYAKRLEAGSRVSAFGVALLRRRFPRAVSVQLARDLQLTLRAFSSAVYVAGFIAALLLAALLAVLLSGFLAPPATAGEAGWVDATWLPPVIAVKTATVLASASCSILVAVLVAYQLPHFWLERAVGASGRQMWETKLWYAHLVSLPVPLLAWLTGWLGGAVPLFYALPLLAECVWLWWLTSSLIGGLAFEVPDRPELAIVLMISFGAVFGLFVTIFWPIGFVLYATNVMRGLEERGGARASFCLMTEGD